MACKTMPFYECRPGIFEIDEFDCASCFVIVGTKSALLLDTGVGIGDLRWVVENRITDKPYTVVATHNHGDHIGGAGFFDEVWMHPQDLQNQDESTAPTLAFRKEYAELIRRREGKYYAYDPENDIRPWPKTPVWKELEDGQTFDLGGRTVTAWHCPGHTAGEMVFIDDQTHTLLCGDACNCNWLLNKDLAPTLREGAQISLNALQRIWSMRDQYDAVYNFHHDFRGFGSPLAPDVLPNLIFCLEHLLEGTAEFKEIPDALSTTGATKTVAIYGDVFVSCMGQDIRTITDLQ